LPITYRIDTKNKIVYTTASGELTDDHLLEHKQKLIQDPLFQPGMKELSDARTVTELKVTNAGIVKFAKQDEADSGLLDGYRLAIVVDSDLTFGMARMYEALTKESLPGLRVFRDLGEAQQWLQIE